MGFVGKYIVQNMLISRCMEQLLFIPSCFEISGIIIFR